MLDPIGEKPCILVIDDEPSVGDALKLVLEASGYGVVLVANGREGIEQVRSRRFGCSIVDLSLPDISGLQVIKHIHEQQPEIPILLITGEDTPQAFAEAKRLGAIGILSKPFRPADILQLITRVMAR